LRRQLPLDELVAALPDDVAEDLGAFSRAVVQGEDAYEGRLGGVRIGRVNVVTWRRCLRPCAVIALILGGALSLASTYWL